MKTALKNETPPSSASFLSKVVVFGFIYLFLAWFIVEHISEKPFLSVFDSATPIFQQILVGLAVGASAGAVQAAWLRYWTRWRAVQAEIASKNPGLFRSAPLVIILISLTVGVTEEIMFRAAVQPFIGIWLASIFFTAVHLNFDFSATNKSDLPFALLSIGTVFVVSLIMGVLFNWLGLFASIAAHIIYDTIVLFAYRNLLSAVKSNLPPPASEII